MKQNDYNLKHNKDSPYIDMKYLDEFINGMRQSLEIPIVDGISEFDVIFHEIFLLCDKRGIMKGKDNVLDMKEFKKVIKAMNINYDDGDKIRIVGEILFKILDDNNSGNISKKEFELYAEIADLSKSEIEIFMKEIDENNNGKIDLNEFLNWFKAMFIEMNEYDESE